MMTAPMDVLHQFPVRKSKAQKQTFRDAVTSYAEGLGYCVTEEKGSYGARNLVIGNPDAAEYLITAHYDTPAAMGIPNLLTPTNPVAFVLYQLVLLLYLLIPPLVLSLLLTFGIFYCGALWLFTADQILELASWAAMIWYGIFLLLYFLNIGLVYFGPANKHNANDNTSGVVALLEMAKSLHPNLRDQVCFVLFDLEEKGLIGSASYRKQHKQATDQQLVLNLDCVGDGDEIRMFMSRKLKKDPARYGQLYKCCGYFGRKSVLVQEKGFGYNPSDYKHFPYGVGFVALKKSRFGLYLGKIHTKRDTNLDITNINILRAAIISMITAAQ